MAMVIAFMESELSKGTLVLAASCMRRVIA